MGNENLVANINIKHNLSRADLHDISAYKLAGDIWNHLFNKYRNLAAQRAIADILDWKMPPGMTAIQAYDDLAQKNENIRRYGVPCMFSEDKLIALFLDRVSEEYRILQTELKYEFGERNRDSLLLALKRREEKLK